MIFREDVSEKYKKMLTDAAETILERGNERHRKTAKALIDSDIELRVVPLAQINASGVTGLINRRSTNRKINRETLTFMEAMAEVHITFADVTLETGGERGAEGTLVHEGLHACDFADIIASFSEAETDPLNIFDLSLYELEHRAAVTSGEYLAIIGRQDYIDEGLQLGIIKQDESGQCVINPEGIDHRMQHGYGVNCDQPGVLISQMIGIKPAGSSSGLLSYFGL